MKDLSAQRRDTMRVLGIIALVAVALLACISSAFAGSEERKGTGGALELRIPVGPRGTALGGAVTGDASGVEAMFWNPAGLATTEHPQVLFTHTQFFADQKLNYFGLAANIGSAGVLGVAAKVLSVGDVLVTTEDAPDGTGQIINPTFAVLGLSWAKQFTDRVRFGATANYVSERIEDNSAAGVAFDFGVQYEPGLHGLRIGMAMKNFGPSMAFSGPGGQVNVQQPGGDPTGSNRTFEPTNASFELPSYFSLAASYDVWHQSDMKLAAVGAFQNNNFTGDDVRGGLEWGYRDMFALRGSYFGSFSSTVDATGNENSTFHSGDDLYQGFAFGAGAMVRTGDTAKLGVDVTWRPVRDNFNDIVDVGLKYMF